MRHEEHGLVLHLARVLHHLDHVLLAQLHLAWVVGHVRAYFLGRVVARDLAAMRHLNFVRAVPLAGFGRLPLVLAAEVLLTPSIVELLAGHHGGCLIAVVFRSRLVVLARMDKVAAYLDPLALRVRNAAVDLAFLLIYSLLLHLFQVRSYLQVGLLLLLQVELLAGGVGPSLWNHLLGVVVRANEGNG